MKKEILEQVQNRLNSGEVSVADIQKSAEYQILKTSQGLWSWLWNSKTSSEQELETMIGVKLS